MRRRSSGWATLLGASAVTLDVVSRLRAIDHRRFDLFAGLFVLVEGQLELLLGLGDDVTDADRLLAHAALVLPGVALMLRSRAPVLAAALAMGSLAATTPLGATVNETITLPFFAIFVVMFSMAASVDGRRLAAGIAIVSALIAFTIVSDPADNGIADVMFGFALLLGAPVLGGRALRNRIRLNDAMRERAERLEREREEAVEQAAGEERERIAGELHDLVSHALSGMVVQASGARRLVATRPERAREAFAAIEESGRDALTEMRRLLGVLRQDDEELALAPQPSLTHLATLVRRAEAAGLPVEVAVDGEPRPLPAGADVIAYRVVQEALRGALDAGEAGAARVRVRYGDAAVQVEVADDGGGTRPLLAIEERVALYGGQLVAGQRRAGGHLVRASLPIGETV